MVESTNLNVSPYFAEYEEDKSYQKVLFKPGTAVQSRELIELQSMLQNQIERMGNNIYQDGTVIEGCNFTFDNDYDYVKVLDNQTDGQPVVLSNYVGLLAVGLRSGIKARVVNFSEGFESQSPILSTLYLNYLNTGTDGDKTFQGNENINIQDDDGTVITTITAASSVDADAIGKGFAVHVTDGICYHRGFFVRVEEQTSIVDRYTPSPSNKSVGFALDEAITNANNDPTLFDTASGSKNENAPGADRLAIKAVLRVVNTDEYNADFFSLADIQNGSPVTKRTDTEFASIDDNLTQRTHEQSGSFTVDKNDIGVESANTSVLLLQVGPGISYVKGKRTQQYNTTRLILPKASDSIVSDSENISLSLGNYVVGALTGNIPTTPYPTVQLKSGSLVVGTAVVLTVAYQGGETAQSITFRAYLFNTKMSAGREFSSVDGIDGGSWSMQGINGLRESSIRSSVFPTGGVATSTLSDISLIHRTSNDNISFNNNGGATITLSGSDQWLYSGTWTQNQRSSIVIVPSETDGPYSEGTPLTPSQYSVTSTGQTLTINLTITPTQELSASIIYDAQRQNIRQMDKVTITRTVTINTTTHPNGHQGPWCLGQADVTQAVSTVNGSNKLLRLDGGARDSHYGLAYLSDPRNSISEGDVIDITITAFSKDTSSGGRGFFSVDSYVDVGLAEIPIYTSSTGRRVDLRDSIDCRPVAESTIGTTNTTNPSDIETFGDGIVFTPDSVIESDIVRNIGRMDKLIVDTTGSLGIIRGVPATIPTPPVDRGDSLTLATITVPPLPSLSPRESDARRRPEYVVSVAPTITKGYTMSDIGAMDRRLRNLEYYTALTALESQTKDVSILDSNGLTRFKNGILVDPFDGLGIADISSPSYSAGIDHGASELIPRFGTSEITLKVESTDNIRLSDDVGILPYSSVVCLEQGDATRTRNCVQSFWNFVGRAQIHPEYDAGVDNTRAPVRNISIDQTQGLVEFSEALNEIYPLTVENTEQLSVEESEVRNITNTTSNSGEVSTTTTTTTTTTENFLASTRSLQSGSSETRRTVGDFVTDVTFSPFMRSRRVNVFITGLRPDTRHYAWFDEVDVNQSMSPATYLEGRAQAIPVNNGGLLPNTSIVKNITRSGDWGDDLVSDANGTLHAIFNIPEGRFIVGDRELLIADVPLKQSLDTATSSARMRYSAFNYSVERAGLTTSTRIPTFQSTSTSLNVTQTSSTTVSQTEVTIPSPVSLPEPVIVPPLSAAVVLPEEPVVPIVGIPFPTQADPFIPNSPDVGFEFGSDQWFFDGEIPLTTRIGLLPIDPVAQTFRILPQLANGGEGIYAESFDLYFASKSSTVGVSIQLRATRNGQPTNEVLPFGDVWVPPSEVNVSDNGSVPTRVTFPTPIFLRSGMEYAVVVKPDANSPEYQVFTRKVGGTDLLTGLPVSQDWGVGVFFSSTNDSAWKSYQDEDMKFRLNRCSFTNRNGRLVLTNSDQEYLTTIGTSPFIIGEDVFQVGVDNQGTISPDGNSVIGNGTKFTSDYSRGNSIVLTNNSTTHVATVIDVNSATSMTLDVFIPDGVYTHQNTPFGVVQSQNDDSLVLAESTAQTNSVFEAGNTIRGVVSGLEAVLSEVTDIDASRLQYHAQRINLQGTTISAGARVVRSFGGFDDYDVFFGKTTHLTNNSGVVASRSNEITRGTGKSLKLTNILTTQSSYISPVIDHITTQAKIISNRITTEALNEHLPFTDNSATRYISKTVELAEGMDAEDMRVYLTSYRPPSTNIEVYGRFLSTFDGRGFEDAQWTPMIPSSETVFSSRTNKNDFKEIEYTLPTSRPILSNTTGTFTATTSTLDVDSDIGLVVGSHVELIYDSGDAYTAYVETIVDSTITLLGVFDDFGADQPVVINHISPEYVSTAIAKDDQMSYWAGSGYHTNFKLFAIKIVLTGTTHNVVPRVRNMRAIAVSG